MSKRQAFSPGEYLSDELDARGWRQTDLAAVLNRPFQHVNLLVNGRRRINAEIAAELAAAFDVSPDIWLNLQAAWDAYNAPQPPADISRRAKRLVVQR